MFIGREREIEDLNGFWGRNHGVLMTCRGRRRIGKSALIAEFADGGGYDPDFAGYFKEAWDGYLHKRRDVIVVLCGSVSAWIAENILNATGFVGRDSFDIELGELSLADSVKLLGPNHERLSTTEKLNLLSLTGGVQKYLRGGVAGSPARGICGGRRRLEPIDGEADQAAEVSRPGQLRTLMWLYPRLVRTCSRL